MSRHRTARGLSRLHYCRPRNLPLFDAREGGDVPLSIASEHDAAVVIVDPVARVIFGRENDSDTFLALYRHTGMRLEECGTPLFRVDHPGKSENKG